MASKGTKNILSYPHTLRTTLNYFGHFMLLSCRWETNCCGSDYQGDFGVETCRELQGALLYGANKDPNLKTLRNI